MVTQEAINERLLEKSQEAFVVSIELYNKPTIKYRVEGFSFLICNAWELMLKAYMIKQYGEESIYFKDHPDRTLSLMDCVKKVYTNDKDPLRMNLEKIIELRNTSTHFITEEYEMVYVPLFQACVINYSNKMMEYFDRDVTELIPQNFLTLSVSMKVLDETTIFAKYPGAIARKFLSLTNGVNDIAARTNSKFAINVSLHHYITKNPKLADETFRIAREGEEPIAILKELRDPNTSFNFTAKNVIATVRIMLRRNHIELFYNSNKAEFNSFHFNNFVNHYGLKTQEKFCWTNNIGNTPQYSYSQQAVDFVFDELRKDPEHILNRIKTKKIS